MTLLRLLFLCCLAVVSAMAQPTIGAVVNSASYILPGLPNSGIAQGSLFLVEGTNLGPASIATVSAFPLPKTLGGTSIQVTVAGTTVDAIMFYSLATQVAAILPSQTPTGTGTITLSYNNQTATAPIVVVQSNLGIFTVASSGTGDAIAFVNADNGLITPTHAANPGDVIVFWGTGLGPVTSDETQPAVQTNMTSVPLQVFIGGQQVTPLFQGRNACCSSVDTVYVKVPQGVSGCAVSVNMQIGNLPSNATSIAVATSGRTCTPITQNTSVGTGTHSYGGLALIRSVVTTSGISSGTKSDSVFGSFEKITYSNTSPPQGSQLDINSYGSCSVAFQSSSQTSSPPSKNTITYLDAGAQIGLAAPFGSRSIPKNTPGAGIITYQAGLDQTATTLTAGQYTFTGTGGPDVGAFTATYNMPAPFVWTNESNITTVTRANGQTITWTGGDPAGYVSISGTSTTYASTSSAVVATFTCVARVSDGSFTVPPVVLLALPPTGTIPFANTPAFASLSVFSFDTPMLFPPPSGIETFVIYSYFSYTNGTVTYQ